MVSLHAALAALALSGAGQTVFYDFHADWCAPCRAMEPTIQELIARGYPVEKVNIDHNRQLAARYGVQTVPCYVMVVDGREVDRVVGGTTLSRLDRMCRLAAGDKTAEESPVLAATRPSVPLPALESRPPFSVGSTTRPAADPPAAKSVAVSPAAQPRPQQSVAPSGWVPKQTPDSHLLAASVRLRIEDPDGQSCGSGTIIDARDGEALILTCGHIFRDSEGKGPIAVDLFGANPRKAVPGRLVAYDLETDIGLVAIRPSGPVAVVPVAPAGYHAKPGDPVVTVGCNNGDRPSAIHSQVTELNKFLGPDSLMVAGEPVEGRSGGGLFSADGRLIGVCNAADKEDQEGLFAALASIHGQLDRSNLAFVYGGNSAQAAVASNADLPRAAMVAVNPPPMARQMPRASATDLPVRQASLSSTETRPLDAPPLSAREQAAFSKIRRKLQEGAEVVCIVRSRTDPTARGEVITLDRASPSFLRQLAGEALSGDACLPTSLAVPEKTPTSNQAIRRRPLSAVSANSGGWQPSAR